ncbi:electron transport complex subunit RsxC [Arenimonas caeni]|uniref:electron transport complex subunit RsxC n=1 Tax=Arenimonas caeni TaxID=2058085 RepID=UPI002A35CF30|nr:electron transport complex subunit RsxC [Arenimonas caeni]MDY0021143.1 electron transport complex subunit RsxC [Arenimonas caeni]
MRPHAIHGGLVLEGHKAAAMAGGLRDCAPPPRLLLPLRQHAGPPCRPVVGAGDRVVRGQVVAVPEGAGAPVHAPLAARVLALESRPLPGPAGLPVPHLLLEPSGGSEDALLPPLPADADPAMLRRRIAEAGVVGLGGAGFPTAEKLGATRDILVLNGAECEPWISCDDSLLRAHAGEVVRGARVLARAAGAARVLLAVEDDMREALSACHAAVDAENEDIEVVAVPARYPAGGERQLILALTGREVPRGGLPRDIGVVVFNVATARAAWRAVALGEPLLERVVTVTGPGVARPGSYRVPLGTPVAHLVEQAGGYTPAAARLLLGGPMMGQALPHDDFPIGKTHSCVLVLDAAGLRPGGDEMPCIRCGDCAGACPSRLLPQQLLWQARAGRLEDARGQGLFDCIECGCCDLACPSHIPLTEVFRRAKGELLAADAAAADAAAAKSRFEARKQRLVREAAEREARLAARKAAAASPEGVAAALERARARRAALQDPDAHE